MKNNAPKYPLSGEIDLMLYINNTPHLPEDKENTNYHKRIVVAEIDLLGLLWLSKIYVR